MEHQEIIFFDTLGFGWVVEKAIVEQIEALNEDETAIAEKSLADLLHRS